MASAILGKTKDGRQYYRIFVSRGNGQKKISTRWYIPEGMSLNTKQGAERVRKALNRAIAEFENKVASGEVKTRTEVQAEKKTLERERRRIKTLRQYGEEIYIPIKASQKEEKTRAYYQYFLDHYIYEALAIWSWPTLNHRR